MKKIATILVLVFAITLTTQAQKKKRSALEQLSATQLADLQLKKMTLALDLTASQQNSLQPIIAEQVTERKAMRAERKALKESGKKRKKLTADERYAVQSKRLDKQIAMKAKMKEILNPEQFEKFEKKFGRKKGKMKRALKKRKMKKKREEKDN